jgi:hypothetical protein
MGYDKKRTAAGLRWVLPRALGASWSVDWDVAADERSVAEAVRQIALPPRAERGRLAPSRGGRGRGARP